MANTYDRDGAGSSDAILAAARASLNDQRAGGRRVAGKPIGQRSAALRRAEQKRNFLKIPFFLVAISMATLLGQALIFHTGHLIVLALEIAVLALATYKLIQILGHKPLTPLTLEKLRFTNPKALVGQTQLWLEAQRPALPAPALDLVGHIGSQLDSLASQLDRLDEQAPAVAQVRTLVGEQLPGIVQAYTAIPPSLRGQDHAGATPDQQLSESLSRISGEIDSVTRQLAEGKLDALAIQTRFLDYKYGDGAGQTPPG